MNNSSHRDFPASVPPNIGIIVEPKLTPNSQARCEFTHFISNINGFTIRLFNDLALLVSILGFSIVNLGQFSLVRLGVTRTAIPTYMYATKCP